MDDTRVDVVVYPSGEVKAVPAGKGRRIVDSQNRGRPRSLLGDRVVLAAGAVAAVGAGMLALLALVYSVVVLASILVGVLVAVLVVAVAALAVGAVAAVRWVGSGDAELLEEGVRLRDAREQWGARPVSAVAAPESERPESEHAVE